jgi:hypothetical protein
MRKNVVYCRKDDFSSYLKKELGEQFCCDKLFKFSGKHLDIHTISEKLGSLLKDLLERNPGSTVVYASSIPADVGIMVPCEIDLDPESISSYFSERYNLAVTPGMFLGNGLDCPITNLLFSKKAEEYSRMNNPQNGFNFVKNWNDYASSRILTEDEQRLMKWFIPSETNAPCVSLLIMMKSGHRLSKDFIKSSGDLSETDILSLLYEGILFQDGNGYSVYREVYRVFSLFLINMSIKDIWLQDKRFHPNIRAHYLIAPYDNCNCLYNWQFTLDRYAVYEAFKGSNYLKDEGDDKIIAVGKKLSKLLL